MLVLERTAGAALAAGMAGPKKRVAALSWRNMADLGVLDCNGDTGFGGWGSGSILLTRRRGKGEPDSAEEVPGDTHFRELGADGNTIPSVRCRAPVTDETY